MYCPGGNATDPIWRVLASSDGIPSCTPLKHQRSNPNPNPNPLANQLWCSDFLTPPTCLRIPNGHPAFLESLMPLKNWSSTNARWSKSRLNHSIRFCGIFSKFKKEFYCILALTPHKHQLYGHLPPIMKNIQVRRTRHAGHCWRSSDELISDVRIWTPTYGRAKAERPARTYI